TEAAGAAVQLVTVPATLSCPDCTVSGDTTDLLATCPRCGGTDVDITGGEEMVLESIKYEPVPTQAGG
ncbi:MAG: hydrogenase/urease maturation nickel metallochaperone HypA, partial [Streptosporangiaceae bacterium]